jgi:hypothetical protein
MLKNFKKARFAVAGCTLAVTALVGGIVVLPSAANAATVEQATASGLVALGEETVVTPQGAEVTIERYMPELRDATIYNGARPETGGPGDEIVVNLRDLVGDFRYATDDGELAWYPGSADRQNGPAADLTGRGAFPVATDWSQFTWRVEGLPGTGVMSHVADIDGTITLVPLEELSIFGATITLIHTPTGTESAPITIEGTSTVNGSVADWVYTAPRLGGIEVDNWDAYQDGVWRDNRVLSWSNPKETHAGDIANAPLTTIERPTVSIPQSGRTDGGVMVAPAGFGLDSIDGNVGELNGIGVVARIGVAYSEPQSVVTENIADRLRDEGLDVVEVALADARDGSRILPASGYDTGTPGIRSYQAVEGVTLTASGTTVTMDFGAAEWTDTATPYVFARLADGRSALVEFAYEVRPADTAAGEVSKRIKVGTELLISDSELLAASRLSGLNPTVKAIEAADLPNGVTRVDGGFEYAGSEEPTTLAFGFSVAETFETPFGPVRPDAVRAPGEVRIEVYADVTPPVVVPKPEEPVAPKPPKVTEPPKGGESKKPLPNFRWETGVDGEADAQAPAEEESIPAWLLAIAGGALLVGLGAVGFHTVRRTRTAEVKAE